MTAQEIIDNYSAELNNPNISVSNKAEIYFNIIFIKISENNRDVYLDIKFFLENYIKSIDRRQFSYDKLNCDKIKECLELLDTQQKLNMYEYLKKLLIKGHFEKDWDRFEIDFRKNKNTNLREHKYWYFNPSSVLRFIYNKSIYSYAYLIILISVFFLFDLIILLPNKFGLWISTFKIEYQNISNNFFINHVSNVVLGLFEIESDFKIIPSNALGVIMLILGKLLKIIFIVKYAADKLLKKIPIDE